MEENKKEKETKIEEKNENVEQNNEEIQKDKAELEELNDRYKRLFAEFENYKKRSLKERESLYNSVLGDIISEILPAIDNLEKATCAECKDENYKHGIELIEKQFKDFLAKNNVQEIHSIGENFDPSIHEAVTSVDAEGKKQGEIVQEYRKGYKIGNKVLRHSMVVVAN